MRLIDDNPAKGMSPPHPKSERRALTDEEREVILTQTSPGLRDMWVAYLLTGLRRAELATLPPEAVELDTPAPYLTVTGKGGKVRTVPIDGEHAVAVFRRLVAAAHERGSRTLSPYTPGSLAAKWAEERTRLEISPEVTLHTFRHDFATYLANLPGVPITEVRDILGHSSVVVTEIYVHPDRRAQRKGVGQRSAQLAPAASSGMKSVSVSGRANNNG